MKRNAAELIAAAVLAGFFAFFAVPNVLVARQRSFQKRTMADMRTIATAWEARATDKNTYALQSSSPAALCPKKGCRTLRRVSFKELQTALTPTYIRRLPEQDGWGNSWLLRAATDPAGRSAYVIRSLGSDGKLDAGISEAAYDGGLHEVNVITDHFEQDIVFSDGNFIRYPEGV